jgi:hypothetical protein
VSFVILDNLPMPPTSNNSYTPMVIKGQTRFLATRSLKAYQESMREWRLQHLSLIAAARAELFDPILGRPKFGVLRVDRFFAFHRAALWTNEMQPKQLDGTNRIKPLDDALAELVLGLDDKYFFSGVAEKVEARDNQRECALVVLSLMQPQTLSNLRALTPQGRPLAVEVALQNPIPGI